MRALCYFFFFEEKAYPRKLKHPLIFATVLGTLGAAVPSFADDAKVVWKDRVGSLTAGKFADIIAVKGDPAQNATELTKVTFVMKGGEVIKK